MTIAAGIGAPSLARANIGVLDRCRRPGAAWTAGTDGAATSKEWHHIVVHHQALHLLVNLSESTGADDDAVARVIVMAYTDSFHATVEVALSDEVWMKRATLDARYGANTRWWWERDHYRLVVNQPDAGLAIDLRLDPVADPVMLTGVALSAHERLSWFFVPRLYASGSATIGGTHHTLDETAAYHDHNWGRFDWGGDFGWEWISGVGRDWSVTGSRLLDGGRSTLTSQYLHVETNGHSATFRDSEITTHSEGRLRVDDAPVVPGVMRLITPSTIEDVPERMHWSARRGADSIDAVVTPRTVARLVIPSEQAIDRVVVLAEIVGQVEINGVLAGQELSARGDALLELLR